MSVTCPCQGTHKGLRVMQGCRLICPTARNYRAHFVRREQGQAPRALWDALLFLFVMTDGQWPTSQPWGEKSLPCQLVLKKKAKKICWNMLEAPRLALDILHLMYACLVKLDSVQTGLCAPPLQCACVHASMCVPCRKSYWGSAKMSSLSFFPTILFGVYHTWCLQLERTPTMANTSLSKLTHLPSQKGHSQGKRIRNWGQCHFTSWNDYVIL